MRVEKELVEYLADAATPDIPAVLATVQRLVTAAAKAARPLTVTFARQEMEGAAPSTPPSTPLVTRAGDPLFVSDEKVIWEWLDVSGRAIEDLR